MVNYHQERFFNALKTGLARVLNAINETASVMTERYQELIYRRGLEDGAELIRILTRSAREQEQKQNRNQESGE